MSWDAKFTNKPLVLLDSRSVRDAIERNAYVPDEDLEQFLKDEPSSDLYVRRLAEAGLLKEACDFLAFAMGRRARIWWGCLCLKDFNEEKEKYKDWKSPLQEKREGFPAKMASMLKENEERFAKDEAAMNALQGKLAEAQAAIANENPVPGSEAEEMRKAAMAAFDESGLSKMSEELEAVMGAISPEDKAMGEQLYAEAGKLFAAESGGASFEAALSEAVKGDLVPPEPIPGKTPMDIAEEKLRAQMADIKAAIDEQMSVFPLKIPGLPKIPSKKRVDAAYDAALRWVMAPTDVNAKLAAEAGMVAGNSPNGMLAQSAFWSGNDLSFPGSETQIVPPPGLAGRGISTSLYMCAMGPGGKLSYEERYQIYLDMGIDVAQGTNIWNEALKDNIKGGEKDWEGRPGFGRVFATEKPEGEAKGQESQKPAPESKTAAPPPIIAPETEKPRQEAVVETRRNSLPGSALGDGNLKRGI